MNINIIYQNHSKPIRFDRMGHDGTHEMRMLRLVYPDLLGLPPLPLVPWMQPIHVFSKSLSMAHLSEIWCVPQRCAARVPQRIWKRKRCRPHERPYDQMEWSAIGGVRFQWVWIGSKGDLVQRLVEEIMLWTESAGARYMYIYFFQFQCHVS